MAWEFLMVLGFWHIIIAGELPVLYTAVSGRHLELIAAPASHMRAAACTLNHHPAAVAAHVGPMRLHQHHC